MLKELGKKRANPYACKTNALKLSACPCAELGTCKHSFEGAVAAVRGIAGVIFDGVTHLVKDKYMNTTMISVSDLDKVREFIRGSICDKEFNLSYSYEYDGTTLTFQHIGQLKFEGFVLDDATELLTTECCTIVNVTHYETYVVDTIPDLTINGSVQALANNPYAFSGVPATDEATAAQLKTDVETALAAAGYVFESVSVIASVEDEGYSLGIYTQNGGAITIGTKAMQNCGIAEMFSC